MESRDDRTIGPSKTSSLLPDGSMVRWSDEPIPYAPGFRPSDPDARILSCAFVG